MKAFEQGIFSRRMAVALVACALGGAALALSSCRGGTNPAPSPVPLGVRVWFDLNRGLGSPPDPIAVAEGRVTLPPIDESVNTRPRTSDDEGPDFYAFSGWSRYTDSGAVHAPGTIYPSDGSAIARDITMRAVWHVDTPGGFSSVVLEPNFPAGYSGALPASFTLKAPPGRDIALPGGIFARGDGFILLGWAESASAWDPDFEPSGVIHVGPGEVVAKTLRALWTRFHQVEFRANGGYGSPFQVEIREGQNFVARNDLFAPPALHFLVGWDTNPAADPAGAIAFPLIPGSNEIGILATSDTILHAIWQRPSHTLRFELGSGDIVAPGSEARFQPITMLHGERITLPGLADISRPFENLSHWVDAEDPGAQFSLAQDAFMFTRDVTLVPAWLDGEALQVTVSFDANGGAPISGLSSDAVIVLQGQPALLRGEVFHREYHELIGWARDPGATAADYPLEYNMPVDRHSPLSIDLYAVWQRPEFTITYLPGRPALGTTRLQTGLPWGSQVALFSVAESGFERQYHRLAGWSETPESGALLAPGSAIAMPNRHLTLYAVWERPRFALTFDAAGGVAPADNMLEGYWGEEIQAHPGTGFAMDFREIYAWNRSPGARPDDPLNIPLDGGLSVPENGLTLYAVWGQPLDRISFDPGAGTGPANFYLYWPRGERLDSLPGAAEGFARLHHDLVGWRLDGGTLVYAPGSGEFLVNGYATLEAVWNRPNVTVTFDANFPAGLGTGGAPAAMNPPRGEVFVLPAPGGLSVAGHEFVGWSANSLASGGTEAGRDYVALSNLTLFAIWRDARITGIYLTGPATAPRGSAGHLFSAIGSNGAPAANLRWSIVTQDVSEGTSLIPSGATATLSVGADEAGADPFDILSYGALTLRVEWLEDPSVYAEAEVIVYGERRLGDWRLVRIGQDNTLAIAWSGQLWSWGDNSHGQLGRAVNATTPHNLPGRVGEYSDWLEVGGGVRNTLGIRQEGRGAGQGGSLWSWGAAGSGALGLPGVTANQDRPIRVGNWNDWIAVAGGVDVSYGLRLDGTLWAWGANNVGQIGDGTNASRDAPTRVGSAAQIRGDQGEWLFSSVSSTVAHAVAVRRDGTLWAWGNGSSGRLGNGFEANAHAPVQALHPQAAQGRRWVTASAGQDFTVAVDDQGVAWSWGFNGGGTLGRSDLPNGGRALLPGRINHDHSGANAWRFVQAGRNHSMGLTMDGRLFTWGQDGHGQATGAVRVNLSVPNVLSPREFTGVDGSLAGQRWISISSGGLYSLAVRADGQLWGWGANANGNLGIIGAQLTNH
ncbi:MAG: InlB B-repeat-containing protein, partial [Treponema sp.]|nr:InlB B-repeat-containing protein [Treponema sp.]